MSAPISSLATADDGAVDSAPDVGVDHLTATTDDGPADAVVAADTVARPYIEVSRHGGRGDSLVLPEKQ